MILQTGQTYRTPWIYGSYARGLDALARRFHRFLRARETHPSTARPVTLNVWEAVYFDHDLEHLAELAECAAAVGVERYVLDDGWFGAAEMIMPGSATGLCPPRSGHMDCIPWWTR